MMSARSSVFDEIFQRNFIEEDRVKTVDRYRLGEVLGSGKFSQVRSGINVDTDDKVAVKCLRKLGASTVVRQNRLFEAEVKNLRTLRHRNIVNLHETMETDKHFYIVLDYLEGKTLSVIIKQLGKLDEIKSQHIFKQIASGISYCHGHNVIHRDLKPSNIMITCQLQVTIIDFGLSVNLEENMRANGSCGSPAYTAPEIYNGDSYGTPVDIWSMGVMLYKMLVGVSPFADDKTKHRTHIYSNIFKKLHIPASINTECEDLLRRMLTIAPDDRITITDILEHGWIKTQETELDKNPD